MNPIVMDNTGADQTVKLIFFFNKDTDGTYLARFADFNICADIASAACIAEMASHGTEFSDLGWYEINVQFNTD